MAVTLSSGNFWVGARPSLETFDKTKTSYTRKPITTLLSITNKMQRYTIFFIIVNALHVSGGFSTHHQELKNCKDSIGYMPSLLAATASMSELAVAASKLGIYPMLCVQFLSS